MIDYISAYKSQMDFMGLDFEAHKPRMNAELKVMTAELLGPFKNDVTAKMSNFRPLSPYITVSHFFHYSSYPQCHQANIYTFFP